MISDQDKKQTFENKYSSIFLREKIEKNSIQSR